MSYKFLGDELYTCYLILQRAENYAKDNYSEDTHICTDLYNLKDHCGNMMRSLGYKEPEVDK